MAQNISLMGADFPDVPAVILPKTGGGTALFTDVSGTTALASDVQSGKKIYLTDGSEATGSYVWNWMGEEAEHVSEVYAATTTALSSTSFKSWEPSSTAKSIKSAVNAGTFVADMVNYEYLLRWRYEFDAVYPAGTSMVSAPERECAEIWQVIMRRPSTLANLGTATFDGNVCITMQTVPLNVYYNASGKHTYTYAVSYGVYPAAAAATFSSTSSDTPTVTMKTPSVSARCSDTYFSTTTASVIDQDNSKFKIKGDLYRMRAGATERIWYGNIVDIYNNGI